MRLIVSRVTVVLLTLALLASPGDASARKKKRERKANQPQLRLRANVQAGFVPLTIHFTARLENVAADDTNFCHAGSFLMLGTYDEHRILQGEDPGCRHDPDSPGVSLTWTHVFTVTRAGSYEFIAMVRANDGSEIFSNGVPVRAVSTPGG